jgi:tetratricopeptide (TPR) repeat protein
LTKSELREDEFVEWIMQAADYVRARARIFVGAAGGAVALVLALNYFIDSQEQAKREAAALLGDMLMAEQTGQLSEAIRLGENLVQAFAGTPAAAQGVIALANHYYGQGRYAEARQLYEKYLSDYGEVEVLSQAAHNGLAACLEAQGQFAEAARAYEAAAQRQPGTVEAALAQMEAARCYALAGDRQRQKVLLEQISRDFAPYPIAARAREEMDMF